MLWLLSLLLFLYTSQGAVFDVSECNVTKECVFSPPRCSLPECHYFASFQQRDTAAIIELGASNLGPETNYLAIGFSDDDLMGGEFVTACRFHEQYFVSIGYNNGKTNDLSSNNSADLELLAASRENGMLYCQLKQAILPSDPSLPQLNTSYFVLLARGRSQQNRLGIHSLDPASPDFPFVSSTPISTSPLMGEPTVTSSPAWFDRAQRTLLTRIHGIIMVPVWMWLVPMAILSARHLKDHFPNAHLKVWFQIHRWFNGISLFLIVISTAIVFISREFSWKGPNIYKTWDDNTRPGALHSITGTIAVLSAFMQLVLALTRCSPESKARPVFNFFHRLFGYVGVITSLLCLAVAVIYFIRYWSSRWLAVALFFGAILGLAIVFVLFEVLARKNRKSEKHSEIELTSERNSPSITHKPNVSVLALWFVSCALLLAVVCGMIALML